MAREGATPALVVIDVAHRGPRPVSLPLDGQPVFLERAGEAFLVATRSPAQLVRVVAGAALRI